MKEFWWREKEIPESESVQKDRETFKRISEEYKNNSNSIQVGFDCTQLGESEGSKITKIKFVVFDQSNNPCLITQQESTALQGQESYKVAVISNAIDYAFTNKLYPGIIFVNSDFNIQESYWQNVLVHEKTHISSPNLNPHDNADICGFREGFNIENWLYKGDFIEEWWAFSAQKKYYKGDCNGLFKLGNRVVDLMIRLDQKDIIGIFKQYGYDESYIKNFQSKWENKDNRKNMIMELIGEARNVHSSRMIFRDLVNTIDPSLFDMWFDGQIKGDSVAEINEKLDDITSIKTKLKLTLGKVRNKLRGILNR